MTEDSNEAELTSFGRPGNELARTQGLRCFAETYNSSNTAKTVDSDVDRHVDLE